MSQVKTSDQFILYTLNDRIHGINIAHAVSIERLVPITKVPNAQLLVEGVINLRGEIIPIINLKKPFGLVETNNTDQNRIIITTINGYQVGLMVDSVLEIAAIEKDSIQNAAGLIGNEYGDLIGGITERNGSIIYFPDYPRALGLNNI